MVILFFKVIVASGNFHSLVEQLRDILPGFSGKILPGKTQHVVDDFRGPKPGFVNQFKLVKNVSGDALDHYVSQLKKEVKKYITKDINYGKAAKRMYNIFRLTGRYPEAAFLRELFDEPTTMLYQVWALIRTIDDVFQPGSSISADTLLSQADQLIIGTRMAENKASVEDAPSRRVSTPPPPPPPPLKLKVKPEPEPVLTPEPEVEEPKEEVVKEEAPKLKVLGKIDLEKTKTKPKPKSKPQPKKKEEQDGEQ